MRRELIDLTGRQFGQWTVKARAETAANGMTRWLCVCTCGTERAVNSAYLRDGKTTGCGCAKGLKSQRTKSKRGNASVAMSAMHASSQRPGARARQTAALRAKSRPVTLAPVRLPE